MQRCKVEVAWLRTLTAIPRLGVPEMPDMAGVTAKLAGLTDLPSAEIAAQVSEVERQTRHDVKAAETWLAARLRARGLGALASFLHFGCTSWDINNLAYALMLLEARREVMLPALDNLAGQLRALASRHADDAMLGRTHGQPAAPTTLGKEFAVYAVRLRRQREQIAAHVFDGKLNGAVGNYSALCAAHPQIDWQSVARRFVEGFGLRFATHTTQIEPYDGMVEFFDTIARANRILCDLAQDASLYVGSGILRMRAIAGETGSSTMPHKVNPIDFENAEGNLAVANALLGMLADKLQISRLQRDLSDSTVLRNIGCALGHSLVAWESLLRGLELIDADTDLMRSELRANWQVLGEAVQTVMRSLGDADAYEKVRLATRGYGAMDENKYRAMVEKLVPAGAQRELLLRLTPESYCGIAQRLALDACDVP